ncbi:MAG TPA: sigma 54-interacting transcriptional regulator [Gemmatimonadales bacterium]|nr:sigma 54-interacting transcriptional regulator [Gemmatimonadales bacterium]
MVYTTVTNAAEQAQEERAPTESLLLAERRSLELIAGGARLTDILTDICDAIDAQDPDIISTVLLMDGDGKRLWPAAGSRIPAAWTRLITPVEIGDGMGSCGTAAYLKQPVIVADIASSPMFDLGDYRKQALRMGLRAVWSIPLLSKTREVVGTFAMYYGEPRAPSEHELARVEGAAQLALIAIESERARVSLERALAAMQGSEDRLRTILDTIPIQAWCLGPDGTVDYRNQRWHDYTGLSREEVDRLPDGRPADAIDVGKEIMHPDDAPAAMTRWLEEIFPAKKAAEFEVRLRRHDGEYRWFMVRVEPMFDEAGNVVQWYGTNTDIEDLKRAEARLRQDEQELRRMLDAIPQTIVVLSPDGAAVYANRTMLEYTGLARDEILGAEFRARVYHPEDVVRLHEQRRRALARGVPFELEQRARRKDGQYRWFLVRFNPVHDEQGRVLHWYATGTDIDDRKRDELRTQIENLALREDIDFSSMFEEIVGSSAPLKRVLADVARVARADSTVLISGETGTGKELIARAIHKRSSRADRAFIRVSCAAIPPSLIASELFGHEKGAFTGAIQRRLGRFEVADGGTIFLDEVGELPAETQITLLRVLEEREFERIGSTVPIAVDVRVLAATNRDLKAAVVRGDFREDLYYRLNVFPIRMPPLRERLDDLPLLVEYLVQRFAAKAGKRFNQVTRSTLDLLRSYSWPGNIRELQNVIERVVVVSEGDTFSVDESWLSSDSLRPPLQAAPLSAIADQERELIESALAESGGRIAGSSGAAAKLGIPRQTLDSKIKAFGIDKHRFKRR